MEITEFRKSILDTPFTPIKGVYASLHNLEDDTYSDVFIKAMRGRFATVYDRDDKSYVRTVELAHLDHPLNPSVNDRFRYYEKIVEGALHGKIKAVFVSGEGGIGKTHTLVNKLGMEEYEEGKDYNIIKGNSTARALFDTLRDNPDKLTIFDDCDGVLKDSTAGNILKAVLDSYARRRVSWLTAKGGSEVFDFTGSVIFLSNLNRDKVDQAVLSRTVMIDLYMTPEEKIQRMRHILPVLDVGKSLPKETKEMLIDMIDKYKNTLTNLNLRSLIKALSLMEQTGDIEIVRYQILNG